MHCKQGMPGAGAGAAAAAAAFGGVRVIDDADVGALEGVAELGVVQLADGARQILWGVKLHHAQHTAAVAEHIHIVWRAHLAEMVLPEQTTLVILAAGLSLCHGLLSFLKKLLIRMHAKVEVCTGLTACSSLLMHHLEAVMDCNGCVGQERHLQVLPGSRHGKILDHGAVRTALGAEVGRHRRRSASAKAASEIIPVSRRTTRVHSTAVPGT